MSSPSDLLSGIHYSEEDAEFDSQLVFDETQFLDFSWMPGMGNGILAPTKQNCDQDDKIFSLISKHLRNVRFTKFAREALTAEIRSCGPAMVTDRLTSSNSVQSATTKTNENLMQLNQLAHPRSSLSNTEYAMFKTIPVADVPNADLMISKADSLEASMKQLKKDIERDRILVNGTRLIGAELGLSAILQGVGSVCDQVLAEAGLPVLHTNVRDHYVLSILSKASRSNAGGLSFQAAQSITDTSKAMLIPQSAIAPPIVVSIWLGQFPATAAAGSVVDKLTRSSTIASTSTSTSTSDCVDKTNLASRWGLVSRVSCQSIFKIHLFDAPIEDHEESDGNGSSENQHPQDPTAFQPKLRRSLAVGSANVISSNNGDALQPVDATTTITYGTTGDTRSSSSSSCSTGSSSSGGVDGAGDAVYHSTSGEDSNGGLIDRTTYLSVGYEDYILFDVNLTHEGEMNNLSNVLDDWKITASVSITEVEPSNRIRSS
mmetsp:Transcript_19089/g.32252  ORF Transcript_19089/g.32252 Transcript_19089/m.32252 type:complete len:488 (-) Transcript_19089:153-1616(-)